MRRSSININLRAILISIVFSNIDASASAQTVINPDANSIANILAHAILGEEGPSSDTVTIDASIEEELQAAGIRPDRFNIGLFEVMEFDQELNTITVGVIYQDYLARRVWVILTAEFEVRKANHQITSVEFYWNAPLEPEVSAFVLPLNTIPADWQAASTHADVLRIFEYLGESAAEPAEPNNQPHDLLIYFVDRISADATIELLYSAIPDDDTGDIQVYERLEVTGWPILLLRDRQWNEGYLKIRYTPGSDKPEELRQPVIIATIELGP